MRSKLIIVYRRSSPRTGREYDSKLIDKRQLNFYLKRGYIREFPVENLVEDIEPEPEEVEAEQTKLKFEDFSDLEKENISNDPRAMMKLAEIHNTTYHVIRKIKGKVWAGPKDN